MKYFSNATDAIYTNAEAMEKVKSLQAQVEIDPPPPIHLSNGSYTGGEVGRPVL